MPDRTEALEAEIEAMKADIANLKQIIVPLHKGFAKIKRMAENIEKLERLRTLRSFGVTED